MPPDGLSGGGAETGVPLHLRQSVAARAHHDHRHVRDLRILVHDDDAGVRPGRAPPRREWIRGAWSRRWGSAPRRPRCSWRRREGGFRNPCSCSAPRSRSASSSPRRHSRPGFGSAVVLFTMAGCVMALNGIAANNMLQVQAPDHLRGRVMGFYSFVVLGMAPFGSFQAGWIAEHFGVRTAVGARRRACASWWRRWWRGGCGEAEPTRSSPRPDPGRRVASDSCSSRSPASTARAGPRSPGAWPRRSAGTWWTTSWWSGWRRVPACRRKTWPSGRSGCPPSSSGWRGRSPTATPELFPLAAVRRSALDRWRRPTSCASPRPWWPRSRSRAGWCSWAGRRRRSWPGGPTRST